MDLEKYGTASDIRELLTIRDSVDDILVGLQGDEVTAPRADLFDLGHAYQLVIEVPGVPQENLEIALQGIELTLAGLRETQTEEAEVLSSERPSGHFQRTFELPGKVDFDAGTAHLSDGLLVVTLPKD